jgi:hypothetical protein
MSAISEGFIYAIVPGNECGCGYWEYTSVALVRLLSGLRPPDPWSGLECGYGPVCGNHAKEK